MDADFFYTNAFGRTAMKAIHAVGGFKVAAWYLHTGMSRRMIPGFIRDNGIDMTPYAGQVYASFADFFARITTKPLPEVGQDCLISPCDGLFTFYPIETDLSIPMKGSHYRVGDLVTDAQEAERFTGGLCLVFRLQASDYHHFCCIDDARMGRTHFVPGQLHSVQPIACETVPVYRLNRRWWTLLDTAHLDTIAQIEVGAMVVGGVTFAQSEGRISRGQEMGNFELAGSTIVILIDANARNRLQLLDEYLPCMGGHVELPVLMGQALGSLSVGEVAAVSGTCAAHGVDSARGDVVAAESFPNGGDSACGDLLHSRRQEMMGE